MSNFKELLKKVKELNKISEFNEMQILALKEEYVDENLVISSPTSSGKTLVAEIYMLNTILEKRRRVIFISPLKALTYEHYKNFKKKYENFNLKVGLSTGDLDSSAKYLENYQIIFLTFEKLDSLIRHKASWLHTLGLIVIDEIHNLDSDRGATLETIIVELILTIKNLQVIGLSATIPNAKELASWLNAKLIYSEYRPIKLDKGVILDNEIHLQDKKYFIESKNSSLENVIFDTLEKNKQALVFTNTRKNSESLAKKLQNITKKYLSIENKKAITKAINEIDNYIQTNYDRETVNNILNGVAYHHAGLRESLRNTIEELFKLGHIKIIVSTPTLCISPNTNVWYDMSEINVTKLKPNNKIFANKNNNIISENILEINKNYNSQNLLKIVTSNGFEIELTKNHKLYVKEKNIKKLLMAKNVNTNQKIATIGKIKLNKTTNEYYASQFIKENNLEKDFKLNENDFYFIGVMLGDGYSGAEHKNNDIKYKGSPIIVNTDKEIFDNVILFCKTHNLYYKKNKNYYKTPQITLTKKKWFIEFLVNVGIDIGEYKHINPKILCAKEQFIKNLLRGLFDSDGYVNANKSIGFSNTSINLIKDIQKLLLRFGIISSIRKRPQKKIIVYKKEYNSKDSYELIIRQKKSIIEFYNNVGFKIKRKMIAIEKLVNKINKNILYCECLKCKYKIYSEVFAGRTKNQKEWGKQKIKIINTLGKMGPLESRELKKILSKDICPICKNKFKKVIKKGFRDSDFDNDIFWDKIKEIKEIKYSPEFVYDIVLPNNSKNDHLFVANGILVHNSAGVNLPAYRVIIHTTYRHSASGMRPIPIKEYLQMSGRAGRKGLDSEGESLIIAKDEFDVDVLFERYVNASPEEIDSQLGYIPTLRTMILSLIANEFIYNDESLEKFFKNTFYAIRFNDLNNLFYKIETILRELESYNFIKIDNNFVKITELGRRVSELYIDPLSANNIITKLNLFDDLTDEELMMLIINTLELRPWIMPSKNKLQELELDLQDNYNNFGISSSELYDDYEILEKYFTCKIFLEWINETSEQELLDNYNLLPGILHNKIYVAEWIAYAISEISKILNKDLITKKAIKMQRRIKDGIKEELLILVELPNIGRVRARKLFLNNIKTINDIKNSDPQMLINILGLKVAQKLLEHLKIEFDINTIFIPREKEEKKLLKKEESKATKKITNKKIKTEAKLQKVLFDY